MKTQIHIIGENVESGARSPSLWNKVFSQLELDYYMEPHDLIIRSELDLEIYLSRFPNLLATAVAYPNKIILDKLLNPNRSIHGGINIMKFTSKEKISKNFDGTGALLALQDYFFKTEITENLMNFTFAIIGTGSTGLSFQEGLISLGFQSEKVFFLTSNKNKENMRIRNSQVLSIDLADLSNLSNLILVNATPGGSRSFPDLNPASRLLYTNKTLDIRLIYDFNYGVENSQIKNFAKTKNYSYLDGLDMNLYQAVKAMKFVVPECCVISDRQLISIMKDKTS